MPVVMDSSYSATSCNEGIEQELVQNWINNIVPQSRLQTIPAQNNNSPSTLDNANALENEDDLVLGAEAQLLQLDPSVNQEVLPDAPCQLRGNEVIDLKRILRQRFAQNVQQSFSSDSSRHSMEQLIKNRVVGAEQILANLGFARPCSGVSNRLPQRFLMQSSKAKGISVEHFVDEKNELGDEVGDKSPEEKLVLPNEGVPAPKDETTVHTFGSVAQTVTLINRFRAKTLLRRDISGTVEPVLRTSAHGTPYWTILEEENSHYLDQFGFYDSSPVLTRGDNLNEGQKASRPEQAWNTAMLSALNKIKQGTDASIPAELRHHEVENVCNSLDDNHTPQKGKPKLGLNVCDIALRSNQIGNLSDVPERFLSQTSTCGGAVSRDKAAFGISVNIPAIEINNNGHPSDLSGHDWHSSSTVSSSTTDENSPSFNDLSKLQTQYSGSDTDTLNLLVVPNDNASTVSSHTLVDFDGTVSVNIPEQKSVSHILEEQERSNLAMEMARRKRKHFQLTSPSFISVDYNDDDDQLDSDYGPGCRMNDNRKYRGDSDTSVGAENDRMVVETKHSQNRTYTTSMYIDSLTPTVNVSATDIAEVVVILGTDRNCEKRETLQTPAPAPDRVYYRTVLDAEVSRCQNENQVIVSPISYRTVPVMSSCHVDDKRCLFPKDFDRRFDRVQATNESSKIDFDSTDHQILYSLMQPSAFLSPQCLSLLTSPSEWLSPKSNVNSVCQLLLEEVKLMQQAINKYRLELNALRLRSRVQHAHESELMCAERVGLLELTTLHSAILEEINNVNVLLTRRMKFIVGRISANKLEQISDLASLLIVDQMIELIQEQLYHSSIINGMLTAVQASSPQPRSFQTLHCPLCHEFTDDLSNTSSAFTESIEGRLSSVEQKIAEWQYSTENMIRRIMQQVSVAEEVNKTTEQ